MCLILDLYEYSENKHINKIKALKDKKGTKGHKYMLMALNSFSSGRVIIFLVFLLLCTIL